jgi:hypothetical protein
MLLARETLPAPTKKLMAAWIVIVNGLVFILLAEPTPSAARIDCLQLDDLDYHPVGVQ